MEDRSRFLTLVKVAEKELLRLEGREKGSSVADSKRAIFSGFPKRNRTQISRRKKSSVIPAENPSGSVKSVLTCQLDGLKLKISRKRLRVAEDEADTFLRPNKVMKLEPPSYAQTFKNPWGSSQPSHLGFAVSAY